MVMPGDNITMRSSSSRPSLSKSRCASRSAKAARPSAPASSPRSSHDDDRGRDPREDASSGASRGADPGLLACSECKTRNYKTTESPSRRGSSKKFCKHCKKHTLHRETK